MLRNLIVLPDGTELYSGVGLTNAIQSTTITECVNSETELRLGSVCSSMLELKLITPRGSLNIDAGTEVTLFKVDEAGLRTQVGLFTLEKPTRPSAHTYKITAYDRVSWLDIDLSTWIKSLTEWPYRIDSLAQMVCEACGLTFVSKSIPNGDFLVNRPSGDGGVTGRRIMEWISEIAGRFCRANAEGEIEFAWYTSSGVTITPSGERFYYQNSLSYEDYVVSEIDAVQIQLAEGENGGVWPEAPEGANSYVIKGNRLLLSNVTEGIEGVLQTILEQVRGATYTPCKVSLPASMDIHAGNTVQITDANGKTITAYIMTKTQSGQRDTLEGTGSIRRDSLSAQNIKSFRDFQNYADSVANSAVNSQTQQDVFDKLTNYGKIPGLFMDDGQLYVNASYIKTGILLASLIKAGVLKSNDDGKTFFLDLDNGVLRMNATELTIGGKSVSAIATGAANKAVSGWSQADLFNKLTNNGTIKGIYMNDGQLYINATYLATGILSSVDGETFYLDLDKGILKMKATELSISGKGIDQIARESVTIGGTNLLTNSEAVKTGVNEFLQYGDLAPIIDKYGLVEYTVSFDIRSADASRQSTVQVYCQNGSGYRYYIGEITVPVTTEWTRRSVTVTPTLHDAAETMSMLAFYGTYDTGNIPSVRRVKVELGNKATDWCPAPEDLKNYADDAAQAAVDAVVDDFSTQEKIFNVLTNNGETQGIYLQGGKIYINMEYLSSGQIAADKFTLRGLFSVYKDDTGFLGGHIGYKTGNLGGIATDGIMIADPDMAYYVIVTQYGGVRLQAVGNDFHITKDQAVCNAPLVINGDVQVNGNITYTGTLTNQT